MSLQRNTCSEISPAYRLHGITELANRMGNAAAAEIYQIKKQPQEQRSYSHSDPEHTHLGFLDTAFAHFHDNRAYLRCGDRLHAVQIIQGDLFRNNRLVNPYAFLIAAHC